MIFFKKIFHINKKMASIPLYIISGVITFITIMLIIIYSVNKKFRSYPFFFNIIITLSITIDNVIRLIPASKDDDKGTEDKTLLCKIQAFTLTFFDKLMLTLMTVFSVISHLGIYKQEFYKNNEKLLFITLTLIGLIICTICSIIFYREDISNRSEYCYVETENFIKKLVDSIVTGLLFIINLICIISILLKIIALRNEDNNVGREGSYNHHLVRFGISLVINLITFIYVLLLINKLLPSFLGYTKDLIYILISLIVELFFTINSELINYIKKIFKCRNDADDIEDLADDEETQDVEHKAGPLVRFFGRLFPDLSLGQARVLTYSMALIIAALVIVIAVIPVIKSNNSGEIAGDQGVVESISETESETQTTTTQTQSATTATTATATESSTKASQTSKSSESTSESSNSGGSTTHSGSNTGDSSGDATGTGSTDDSSGTDKESGDLNQEGGTDSKSSESNNESATTSGVTDSDTTNSGSTTTDSTGATNNSNQNLTDTTN